MSSKAEKLGQLRELSDLDIAKQCAIIMGLKVYDCANKLDNKSLSNDAVYPCLILDTQRFGGLQYFSYDVDPDNQDYNPVWNVAQAKELIETVAVEAGFLPTCELARTEPCEWNAYFKASGFPSYLADVTEPELSRAMTLSALIAHDMYEEGY